MSCGNSGRSDAVVVLRAGPRALIAPIGGGMVDFTVSIVRGTGGGIDTACRLGATAVDVQGNTSGMSACFVDDTLFAYDFDSGMGYACVP